MSNNSRVRLMFMSYNWKDSGPYGMLISSILYTVAFFMTPAVTKIILDAAILDLQTKGVITLRKCTLLQTEERNQANDFLKALLKKLANYVDMMSEGDRAKILSSGFEAYTFEYAGAVTVFTVVNGAFSGDVIASWPSDPNNHGYVVRYSINEDKLRDIYTQVNAGTTGCTITDLIKGTDYLFSMCIIYSGSQSPWSDPIALTIL